MKIRPFVDGTVLHLSIELTREEVAALNLEQPLPAATFVFTIDFHKLRPWFRQVLRSKSKRTVAEGGAFELRTAGDRPLRALPPVEPPTVRDPRAPIMNEQSPRPDWPGEGS